MTTAQTAKEWWSGLSLNEQKAYKLKYLGQHFPNCSVYTKNGQNLIIMYNKHHKL